MPEPYYRHPVLPGPIYGYGRERRYFPNLSIPSLMPSPADLPPNADAFAQGVGFGMPSILKRDSIVGDGDGVGPGPAAPDAPGIESEPTAGPGYGGVMGALGGLAGLATGGIGLGAFASAIGQAIDAANAPAGFSPNVTDAALSAITGGLAGQSIATQANTHVNEVALDENTNDPNPFAGPGPTSAPAQSAATLSAVDNANFADAAGIGGIGSPTAADDAAANASFADDAGIGGIGMGGPASADTDAAGPAAGTVSGGEGGDDIAGGNDAGAAGSDSIVCTAARDAGLLSRAMWATAARYGRVIRATDPDTFAGYQRAFSGLARGVREGHPLARFIAWALAPAWVRDMAYRMGEAPQRSWLGAAVMWGGMCVVRMQARR